MGLIHGGISHGVDFTSPPKRRKPISQPSEPVALFVRCFEFMDCEGFEKRFPRRAVEKAREIVTYGVAKRIFSRFFDHGRDVTGIRYDTALPPSPAPRKRKDANALRIQATKPLFAWDALEDSPTLKTIQRLLEVIPDDALVNSLQAARGKGRDDVPVRVTWGVLVLSVA
jgi:hypothetical protein